MERDEEPRSGTAEAVAANETKAGPRPDRVWSERFVPPVKFRRFTGRGFDGTQRIYIQFDLPPEQDRLDPRVYEILKELKYLDRSPEHGGGFTHTGLKAVSNGRQKAGSLWSLPDTPIGRTA